MEANYFAKHEREVWIKGSCLFGNPPTHNKGSVIPNEAIRRNDDWVAIALAT
jgi:hypothetical protein